MSDRTTAVAPAIALERRPPTSSSRAVRLHPWAAGRYLELVAPIAFELDARLEDGVMANRVAAVTIDPPRIHLHRWRRERRRFADRLRSMATWAGALVLTDVRDCYGSIAPAVVRERLVAVGVERDVARSIG